MNKKPYPSETQDRYIVRFPDGMRDKLRSAASQNNRSMNSEIVSRIQDSLDSSVSLPAIVKHLAEATAKRLGVSFNEALCILVVAGDAKDAPHVTYMRIPFGTRYETVQMANEAIKQFVPSGSVQYGDGGD